AMLIDRLGFVQLDSIATVERAHHMILFARRPAYKPADLDRLLERERMVFEHWTHDAAAIPMDFYPHWKLRFARDAQNLRGPWQRWQRHDFLQRTTAVLDHVRENGPVCSADLRGDAPRKSGGWWDWHPDKTALEYLWRSGALAVTKRVGFQKFYDLAERVIPAALHGVTPDPADTVDWCCAGALDRLGFATPGELAAFWAIVTPAEARAWCHDEARAGRLIEIAVQGADGSHRHAFARPDVLHAAEAAVAPPARLRVLSPFDPALRDRNRAERLFGFRYRIEVFTPAARRQYGYYVFPLLEGANLIGRIDMKAHRSDGVLRVTALWPEAGVRWGKGRQARLEAELDRVARFAGCERVEWLSGWLRDTV
ncbi:MAG: winged helix DNA-binding domain-containing protein, partial [Rhodobacterales bacterium]|nr:winged helix DNA-binding domain-containing protein [Rhodobacterales bacterium]MDX5412162.1 winged helix DNA-binding domain-containing protein [Rhodobacterales bacterium]